MEDIYGAPGFSAPYDMTPEEFAAFLKRLASQGQNAGAGGGAFGGQAMSPAGTSYAEYGVAAPEEPVVDPRLVQKFMQFSQQGPPIPQVPQDLTGSYTQGINETLGTEGVTGPATEADLNMLRPPDIYNLPQDEAMRQSFRAGDAGQSAMYVEEKKADAEYEKAKAATIVAESDMLTAKMFANNPGLAAKSPYYFNRSRGGNTVIVGGGGTPGVPTGAEDQNITGQQMVETAQLGAAYGPSGATVRPIREIGPNDKPRQVGDFVRQGNVLMVFDGKKYIPYRG